MVEGKNINLKGQERKKIKEVGKQKIEYKMLEVNPNISVIIIYVKK